MKTLAKALSLLIVLTVTFVACEKNDNLTDNPTFNPLATGDDPKLPNGNGGGNGNGNSNVYMNFEKDSSTYSLDNCYIDTTGVPGIALQLVGQGNPLSQNSEDHQSISFDVISDSLFVKEIDSVYSIGDSASVFNGTYFADYTSIDDSLIFISYTGEFEFTSITEDGVEGKFSFEAANTYGDSVSINNGKFKASYLE